MRDFTTPTRVQLSKGPVKYDTPLLNVSASIFLSTRAAIACENNVADIDKSVFGLVDLYSVINGLYKMMANKITSGWYPLYPHYCYRKELCSKLQKRTNARQINHLQRKQTQSRLAK